MPKALRRNPLVEPRADPRSDQCRRQAERGDQQNIRRDLSGDGHADTGERQDDEVEGLIDGAVRVGGAIAVGELQPDERQRAGQPDKAAQEAAATSPVPKPVSPVVKPASKAPKPTSIRAVASGAMTPIRIAWPAYG